MLFFFFWAGKSLIMLKSFHSTLTSVFHKDKVACKICINHEDEIPIWAQEGTIQQLWERNNSWLVEVNQFWTIFYAKFG